MTDLHTADRLDDLRERIDAWLVTAADEHPLIEAVDRGTSDETPYGEARWYVRMRGEDKDVITVWLTLGQRTLRFESYVLPAPPENVEQVMELLLRRNDRSSGAHYSIGAEDAIYLRGQVPDSALTADEVDRVLGTVYTAVEADFRALVQLAFASHVSAD